MKYYLDQDLSPKIAEILKKNKIDAVSAYHVGMLHVSDLVQLEYATAHNCCMVTRNRNDFVILTTQFFNENRKHCGVLLISRALPGSNFGLIAQAMAKYALKHPNGMAPYFIDYLKG